MRQVIQNRERHPHRIHLRIMTCGQWVEIAHGIGFVQADADPLDRYFNGLGQGQGLACQANEDIMQPWSQEGHFKDAIVVSQFQSGGILAPNLQVQRSCPSMVKKSCLPVLTFGFEPLSRIAGMPERAFAG